MDFVAASHPGAIVDRRAELADGPATISITRQGSSGFDASDDPTFSSLSIEYRVGFPVDLLPVRYGVDEEGRRVLIGLSIEETFEFETLDDLAPLDETGTKIPWCDGVPITDREKRWLELYQKHEDAWRKLLATRVVR